MVALKKKLWWALLAVGAGGLLPYLFSITWYEVESMPWPVLTYFAITTLLAFISALRLRRLYRLQPLPYSGYYHLSLLDLMIVSVLAGFAYLTIFKFWPDVELRIAVPTVLTLVGIIVGALLVAARRGFVSVGVKWLFTCGFATMVYGALWCGFMIAFGILIGAMRLVELNFSLIILATQCFNAILEIFWPFSWSWNTDEFIFPWLLRTGWMAFIVGYIVCHFVMRHHRKTLSSKLQTLNPLTESR